MTNQTDDDERHTTLADATQVVQDGVILLECVRTIEVKPEAGHLLIATDDQTFSVQVALVDGRPENPAPPEGELSDQFGGAWGQHPEFPIEDWRTAVENNDTRLGYWNWVEGQIAS